jgi:RNA polymerase sigma-B factor
MREVSLTDGRRGRDLYSGGDRWRPLAQHLAARFAAADGSDDDGAVQVAVATILDAERRLGSTQSGFSTVIVPLVVRALRRHRRERLRRRPASGRPHLALQLAIMDAESKLSRRLGRCPTVAEVANHLDVAEHQIVAELATGWSAGSGVVATG